MPSNAVNPIPFANFQIKFLGGFSRFAWAALSICFGSNLLSAADPSDYQRVREIFRNKCFPCHGTLKQEADLRLDHGSHILAGGASGPILDADQWQNSPIIQRIRSTDPAIQMPPEGERLTSDQIAIVERWLEGGAVFPTEEPIPQDWRTHWAFQPLSISKTSSSPRSIDDWIDLELAKKSLRRSPPATRSQLLQRASLDLLGLPPTAEEIESFESDSDPASFARRIDQILASPRYGERWAQHWLDVLRYADTHGYEVNTPRPNAWPYRDYVIRAFNRDTPYDQFVREQIAGDAYREDAATGFLVAAPVLLPGQIGADDISKRLARQDALSEIIAGTGNTILGLSLGCARCHDHKFDPFTQVDYYSLQSFFAGVEYEDRPIEDEEAIAKAKIAQELEAQLNAKKKESEQWQPLAFTARTLIIDDEDLNSVTLLRTKNGHGDHPAGTKPGYRDDPGDANRFANLGQGRYTWWDNSPGIDVMTYNPNLDGNFDLWISWGVHGSGVHTRDARYLLDRDGDLSTSSDQIELASVDQYYRQDLTTGTTEEVPQWSGLRYVGSHRLDRTSRIVLRGGQTGTGITADAIVLQELLESESPLASTHDADLRHPKLRAPVRANYNLEKFPPIVAKSIRFHSEATIDQNRHEPCLDELEVFACDDPNRNVALAENGVRATSSGNYSDIGIHQLPHIHDGLYGNSHSWISNTQGTGWVQLDFPNPIRIDRVVWSRDRESAFADRLPIRYRIEVADEQGNWTTVAGSSDRLRQATPDDEWQRLARNAKSSSSDEVRQQLAAIQELTQKIAQLRQPKLVFAGRFREPDPTFVLARGDAEQPLQRTHSRLPDWLRVDRLLTELDDSASEQQRRLWLAQAMTSESQALVARVIVNRVWQHHFGIGLVDTPNDFGLNGSRPSHPGLLDWLSAELIRSQWSLKSLHRMILLSETYQQSDVIDRESMAIDADCRLLWRYPSRRLEAEAIRDKMLNACGQLHFSMGGPGFDFFRSRGGLDGFPPVTEFTQDGYRRMIYSHKVRMEPVPIFGAFDCPDAGQPIGKRSLSTTALQALNLFNGPFVIQCSQVLSDRVQQSGILTSKEQVRESFRRILNREPRESELEQSVALVEQHDLTLLIRVLFNSNEFLMLP